MKKLIILLSLGLFAAAASANEAPKTEVKPAPADVQKVAVETVPKATLDAVIAERDQLRLRVNQDQVTIQTFKQQRDQLASSLLDATASLNAANQEIGRLTAPPPATPPK